MALSKGLIPLLFVIASSLFLMVANKVHCQDTTSFQIDSFDPNASDLTYQGDAFVPSGSSYLRLTKTDSSGMPSKYSYGRVVYSKPVQFWEPGKQATFETTLRLNITSVNNNPADGLAFFIVSDNYPFPTSSTGGTFGLFTQDSSSVFAVEFDIFINSEDPDFRHIGIDINDKNSKNVTTFDDPFGEVVTARINYDSSTRRISVVATYGSLTSSVTYVYDLKTILSQQVRVGISAATGGQIALHDIYSWYFTSTLVWDGNNVRDSGKNETPYLKQYA